MFADRAEGASLVEGVFYQVKGDYSTADQQSGHAQLSIAANGVQAVNSRLSCKDDVDQPKIAEWKPLLIVMVCSGR